MNRPPGGSLSERPTGLLSERRNHQAWGEKARGIGICHFLSSIQAAADRYGGPQKLDSRVS